ncbi:Asp-tRNA(Asn)/Glu-tRNA(Gln) amidotransferase A subunit family amidase [Rathayibacter sp. PhB151]|uniref:AtzH-like domain-containing protein n=1 Tax=Rathayibacter sp. PhB151 TaxID=2485189 RepID=UPI0010641BF3|nr:AtzH-like domain-containing protein [Rathayibacter sp. PhB151]TDX78561.1 Asp-tRNA(Asn)/Glu-tRNA(Gln) amidotransferase A subunit family amidase [Rathayibacter sp. PhB151]
MSETHGIDPRVTTLEGELPDGLVDAVLAYEAALTADDVPALADAFVREPTTLRGDASGLLVGHEAITGFRGRRGGTPPRALAELHVRALGADDALVVTVNLPARGGRGLVTQLWTRDSGVWRVRAAQVQAPAPALDARVWRAIGAPLVPASGSGSLDGLDVAVKDLFAIEGQRIGAGIPVRLAEAAVERSTAPAVAMLLAAGASVRGIAQTDEFAYSIAGRNSGYGTPPNPAVPGAIPGGSSSGPATAVSLGQASIGLATDTAGSIRVPASYQGLWGLRTTHGAVPVAGLLPLAPSFDTVGWLTRDLEVLRRVARVALTGPAEAPADGFVVCDALLERVDAPVAAAFSAVVDGLGAERIELPPVAEMFEAFRTVQAAEAWASDGAWVAAHPGVLAPDVQARFDAAARIDAESEAAARERVAGFRERLDAALAGRVLLLPSASSVAPALDASAEVIDAARTATLGLTCLAGIGGYPALSVPRLSVDGRPVGLCLVGPRGADPALLELAAEVLG